MDRISRDTIVPTSSGEQIIYYNEYSNGIIDTELGIPMVNGILNREVTKLNSFSAFSIGLGLGYTQPLGKLNVNAEFDIQRSFFTDLKGLGREEDSDRILSLDSFENYFNSGSQIGLNTNLTVDYFIASGISINGGVQYQWGTKSLVNVQTGHSEHLNLLRLSIGIKKML
ncbi:MAG: hypothetical protein P1U56_12105 [Saprospiraceae bacterium]|nr:hypothetical protein [Saprospiraceae bacterium]